MTTGRSQTKPRHTYAAGAPSTRSRWASSGTVGFAAGEPSPLGTPVATAIPACATASAVSARVRGCRVDRRQPPRPVRRPRSRRPRGPSRQRAGLAGPARSTAAEHEVPPSGRPDHRSVRRSGGEHRQRSTAPRASRCRSPHPAGRVRFRVGVGVAQLAVRGDEARPDRLTPPTGSLDRPKPRQSPRRRRACRGRRTRSPRALHAPPRPGAPREGRTSTPGWTSWTATSARPATAAASIQDGSARRPPMARAETARPFQAATTSSSTPGCTRVPRARCSVARTRSNRTAAAGSPSIGRVRRKARGTGFERARPCHAEELGRPAAVVRAEAASS